MGEGEPSLPQATKTISEVKKVPAEKERDETRREDRRIDRGSTPMKDPTAPQWGREAKDREGEERARQLHQVENAIETLPQPQTTLDQVRNGEYLDRPPVTITLDNRTLTVAFKADGIVLNGVKYTLTAEDALWNFDFDLTLSRVTKTGGTLAITAGAKGTSETCAGDGAFLERMLRSLLQNGQVRYTTSSGRKIWVHRAE